MFQKQSLRISVRIAYIPFCSAMRPSRPQDKDDFNKLCERNGRSIDWKMLNAIATEIEASRIRESVLALAP